nr:venom protein U-MPTX.8-26 [Megalopyge opercularis]
MNIIISILAVLLPIVTCENKPFQIRFNDININARSRVDISGEQTNPIGEKEVYAFGFTDVLLKEAIYKKNRKERKPDEVFISPTGKAKALYEEYSDKWAGPVKTTVKPLYATVLRYVKKPVIVNMHKFTNLDFESVGYSAQIIQAAAKKMENTWSSSNQFDVSASVSVGFKSVSAGIEVSSSNSWGKDKTVADEEIITVSSTSSVELDAGESLKLQTNASKAFMEVEVVYDVRLSGCIIADYENPYKGHHYYCLKVNTIPGLKLAMRAKEIIKVDYFYDIEVTTDSIRSK